MYLSYANALDELLHYFVNKPIENDTSDDVHLFQGALKELSISIQKRYDCNEQEIRDMLLFLSHENMIEYDGYNHITFKGRDFFKEGGYTQQRKNARSVAKFSRLASWFLIFGACATVIIAFVETWGFFVPKSHEVGQKEKPHLLPMNQYKDTVHKKPYK